LTAFLRFLIIKSEQDKGIEGGIKVFNWFRNMEPIHKKLICVTVLIIGIVLSRVVFAPVCSEPEFYKGTLRSLDEKQTNVLEMTATASASSVALAAIPGDATTPIAEKIADMAGYFIIILSVIIMEKYILTIAGYLTFAWLIPIAFALIAVYVFSKYRVAQRIAAKLLVLSFILMTIVPASVQLTKIIEKTNEASINTTMENVKEIQKEVEEVSEEESIEEEEKTTESTEETAGTESPGLTEEEQESEGPFDQLYNIKKKVNGLIEDTKKSIQETTHSVGQLSEEAIKKAKDTLNDFVEVVVVMLVTTCGVPILTLVVLVWFVQSLFGPGVFFGDSDKR